eukprot:10358431-Alexandrium_andersonii.AAC.1
MATWGAAKRHPKLPCQRTLAHSTAPGWRRPREGSEGPPWRGAGLPLGRLGHRKAARVTTYTEFLRLGRLARTGRGDYGRAPT